MMRVEHYHERLNASTVLPAVLDEFSAVTDYRTLQDSLPRRLTGLLRCQYVLFYKRIGESLQFASGTFDERPGWSTSLLNVAHINPIDLNSDRPEARAWRSRRAATAPIESPEPTLVAVPLLYRQRVVGILVGIRQGEACRLEGTEQTEADAFRSDNQVLSYWSSEEILVVEATAGIIAMLLENTRLLEHDRERIHELQLLKSIGSQMNCSVHELERLHTIVIQRTREIALADLCELILPTTSPDVTHWVNPTLRALLFQHLNERRQAKPAPLIIERSGDFSSNEYLDQLPTNIKTFFALPMISGNPSNKRGILATVDTDSEPQVLGIVIGAYYHPWKLRQEELMMLQVLASQASASLENIRLMTEVVEARNEARKLLRQVLDDQRLKELILESIPSGLITIDTDGRITTFNRAAEKILGYHPFEALGQPLRKILNLEGRFPALLTDEQADNRLRETLITVDRQGQKIVLDVTMQLLCDGLGKPVGSMATFTDVTAMQRLEEEKRRLDHLAALGKMAASVAHEVRNPLASIKITMQMLKDDLAKDDLFENLAQGPGGTQESVAIVLKEVERLDTIVRDLLLFARPRQVHRVPCDLYALNEHVLQIMQMRFMEAGIKVHRVLHTEGVRGEQPMPLVQLDMEQIKQVLFNLYTNAAQAMPEGGILTVSFRIVRTSIPMEAAGSRVSTDLSVPQEPPIIAKQFHTIVREAPGSFTLAPDIVPKTAQEQRWLELAISDTGIGIAPDLLGTIFQPFFTTKAHGIGLGLPITQRLIEEHHGHIFVESRLGYGATFSVRFPFSALPEEMDEGYRMEREPEHEFNDPDC